MIIFLRSPTDAAITKNIYLCKVVLTYFRLQHTKYTVFETTTEEQVAILQRPERTSEVLKLLAKFVR